ncbi:MAG TPA: electron transfer flavoprotein subunit alpha/FixB family protein [Steroidobacteraceae bacterium]|nr:electron transfer flavoprotein subunit alpha/FixB family protein [Steroidobacteraceae bacterium]
MSTVLIVAEHDGRLLNAATAKCVSCASLLPDPEITIAVFGRAAEAVAQAAAALRGVSRVLLVDDAACEHALATVLAPQVAALARQFTHVFGPSTTFGKDLMPRVAALLDAPQVSDIMAVESSHRFRRPIYAGNAVMTVEVRADLRVVATVRTASFDAAPAGGSAAIEPTALPIAAPTYARFISVSAGNSDRPDLQTASRVVSGGRALGSPEKFGMIHDLAQALGAAVGASRAAVDSGYAPNELQVGQTGKIIAPDLYIALGISGAIQHLTGIKDAKTIVAINKDADAPIFEVADLGLVGDLFTIVPELIALLKR